MAHPTDNAIHADAHARLCGEELAQSSWRFIQCQKCRRYVDTHGGNVGRD